MNINVIGRLGRDAESVTSKNGAALLRYTLAVDEYNSETKQNDTIWLNVLDATDNSQRLKQYLTKGKMINLVGNYRPSLYNGQNGTMIDHNVRAYNWNFVNSGKPDATATTPTQTTVTESATNAQQAAAKEYATVAAKTGTFVPPSTKTVTPIPTPSTPIDDLPF